MKGHIEVFTEKRGVLRKRTQYRWRIKAKNGRIIATGGEGYNNLADLWHAISLIADMMTAYLTHDGEPK